MNRERIWIKGQKLWGRTGEKSQQVWAFAIPHWKKSYWPTESMKTTLFDSCTIEKDHLFRDSAPLRISVWRICYADQICCSQIEGDDHYIPSTFKTLSSDVTMTTERQLTWIINWPTSFDLWGEFQTDSILDWNSSWIKWLTNTTWNRLKWAARGRSNDLVYRIWIFSCSQQSLQKIDTFRGSSRYIESFPGSSQVFKVWLSPTRTKNKERSKLPSLTSQQTSKRQSS
jgi:hypothetical protein